MFESQHKLSREIFESQLRQIYRVNTYTGERFGVEIEIEARSVDSFMSKLQDSKRLQVVHDGSLRGAACEVIFQEGLTYKQTEDALKEFDRAAKHLDGVNLSDRCSVHVHYNLTHLTLSQIMSAYVTATLLEPYLIEAVGGDARTGNYFCLSGLESDTTIQGLIGFFRNRCDTYSLGGFHKYQALNLSSISRFGTLEWRMHKGCINGEQIFDWCTCIREIMNVKPTAIEICQYISEYGTVKFLEEFLPNVKKYLLSFNKDIFKQDNGESFYIAKRLAYCVDIVDTPAPKKKKTKKKSSFPYDEHRRSSLEGLRVPRPMYGQNTSSGFTDTPPTSTAEALETIASWHASSRG